jgi:dipeptidyl-peptidase-3
MKSTFNYFVDQFEDMRVLKYKLPGFESLSLQQKKYIYFLSQAALSGRDILWDQNFRYNLLIIKTIEGIIDNYSGDRKTAEYAAFMIYAKRLFFANGIHHHYSRDKLKLGFNESYFVSLVKGTEQNKLPLANGQTDAQLILLLSPIIFDEKLFVRKVDQKAGTDMITGSASNFYEGVTQKEVEGFYAGKLNPKEPNPLSLGLNSKVVKKDGKIVEEVYRSGGLYGTEIDRIIMWFEKAITVAETDMQRKEIKLLIDFYRSGDLKKWDDFNVVWVQDTEPVVDYNNGFIETYSDPFRIILFHILPELLFRPVHLSSFFILKKNVKNNSYCSKDEEAH